MSAVLTLAPRSHPRVRRQAAACVLARACAPGRPLGYRRHQVRLPCAEGRPGLMGRCDGCHHPRHAAPRLGVQHQAGRKARSAHQAARQGRPPRSQQDLGGGKGVDPAAGRQASEGERSLWTHSLALLSCPPPRMCLRVSSIPRDAVPFSSSFLCAFPRHTRSERMRNGMQSSGHGISCPAFALTAAVDSFVGRVLPLRDVVSCLHPANITFPPRIHISVSGTATEQADPDEGSAEIANVFSRAQYVVCPTRAVL